MESWARSASSLVCIPNVTVAKFRSMISSVRWFSLVRPRFLILRPSIGLNFLSFLREHFIAWALIDYLHAPVANLLLTVTLTGILTNSMFLEVTIRVIFLIE